jgi:DNA-binding transcriptional ArsR family regulator
MSSTKTYAHPVLEEVTLASAMQALADPCRVAIVRALMSDEDREFACNEIELEISKATVSHHFETLREAGVIMTRVEGRKCLSSVRRKEFAKRFPGLLELVLRE